VEVENFEIYEMLRTRNVGSLGNAKIAKLESNKCRYAEQLQCGAVGELETWKHVKVDKLES
jgi:hypothetical protein